MALTINLFWSEIWSSTTPATMAPTLPASSVGRNLHVNNINSLDCNRNPCQLMDMKLWSVQSTRHGHQFYGGVLAYTSSMEECLPKSVHV